MNHSEEIKNKLDIVDIIGEYLSLKSAGSNFRARCPFHNEKTPSFMISPDKQIWHCFGCGKGGDLISFVMEMEGLDFLEALKLLAPRAGVVLDKNDFSKSSKKDLLLEILNLSKKYFHLILMSGQDKNQKVAEIREYLSKRGLDDEGIKNWQIGYSLDNYDDLLNFLRNKKISDNDILLSGMAYKNDRGKLFNRFRDRIMFPINDVNGRTVAFTARINPNVKDDKGLGKYINSPQSDIYDKSKILFALDRAKMKIKEKDEIVLVEGQMDAISAHEKGFSNVVAVSGTALTLDQLNLIKRYTKNIVLAFDQDSAGEGATDRGISEALKMGFNLKIANLKEGKDPDEIIKDNPDNFATALKEAQNIIEYYMIREFKEIDIDDIYQKNKAVSKVLNVIAKLYNKIEQDFWLKELGQKAKVDELFLREELQRVGLKNQERKIIKSKGEAKGADSSLDAKIIDTWENKLMENLLSLMLKFDTFCEYVFNNLSPNLLTGKYEEFYNYFLIYYNKSKNIEYQGLASFLAEEGRVDLVDLLKKISLLADFNWSEFKVEEFKVKEEIVRNILEIKRNYFKEAINKENELLKIAEKNGDSSKVNEIMNNLKILNDDFRKIM